MFSSKTGSLEAGPKVATILVACFGIEGLWWVAGIFSHEVKAAHTKIESLGYTAAAIPALH
jgi:hypothetical protein